MPQFHESEHTFDVPAQWGTPNQKPKTEGLLLRFRQQLRARLHVQPCNRMIIFSNQIGIRHRTDFGPSE